MHVARRAFLWRDCLWRDCLAKARAWRGVRGAALVVLFSLLLAPLPLRAQELPVEHYTAQDEINPLPKSPVLSTYQDSLGHLWIANWGLGILRYDGQKMEAYEETAGGLGAAVFEMQEGKYGRLWVMSNDHGLSVSERPLSAYAAGARVRFVDSLGGTALYRKPVSIFSNALAVDARGWVRLGTDGDGLIRYRFDGPNTVIADTIRTGTSEDSTNVAVTAVIGRRDGSVWVGLGEARLLVFEEGGRSPRVIEDVPCSPVQSLYEDAAGVLWGGCQGGRLWRLNEKTDDVEFVQVGPTLEGNVTSILEIAPGTLWVSGIGLGIWEVDTAHDRAVHYTRKNGLLDINVWDLTQDREGNVWVSQNTGLSKLQSNQAAFRAYTSRSHTGEQPALPGVEALAAQPDVRLRTAAGGTTTLLAVGTTGGLSLIREDGAIEYVTTEQGLSSNAVLDVCLDGAGGLWASTREGVDLITFGGSPPKFPSRGTTQRTITLFGKPATLSSYNIGHTNACGPLPLSEEAGGNGAAVCFAKWSQPVLGCRVDTQWFFFGENAGLPDDALMSFALDASGHLYAGSKGAPLYRSTFPLSVAALDTLPAYEIEAGVDKITQRVFEPVLDAAGEPLADEEIADLLRVGKAVWVATTGDDLLVLEGSPPRVAARIDTAKLGVAINTLAVSPRTGSIWAGTTEGLVKIDPASREVGPWVTEQDGLLANLASGPGAVAVGADGTVYHGSAAGLTLYRPERDRPNPVAPSLVSRRISFSEDAAGNNELELDYAALSFANERQVRYRTRLVGYDDEWSPPTTETSARYTNLSAFAFPKAYAFEVKAANNDGVWTEMPLTHTVWVQPAWWVRWWALLLYGGLLAGVVFAAGRVQRRRLVRREREKTRERELEQARETEQAYAELRATKDRLVQQEKMASLGQLTAGIAHEIKNPLNFITNFAEVNEELAEELREALANGNGEEVSFIVDDIEQNAGVIKQHGRRADAIVRSMMAHARTGTGERQVVGFNGLVDEHVELAYHGKRAQVPGFPAEIERDYDADVGEVEVVPQEIGRVVLNLVGNAFDAVAEHAAGQNEQNGQYVPRVTVSTRRAGEEIELRVEDNGPGIPEEVRAKIFEPFFTTKPTGSGTGLGLSMSYDIVTQSHGGTLTVESAEGEGAAFVLTLPVEGAPARTTRAVASTENTEEKT